MSTLDTGWTNEHTPILVAVLVVLVAYILAQKIFKARGCPFAKASKTTGTATMGSCGNLQLTLAELAEYDGRDASKPLCISVRGTIYDVSSGRSFYGPGGPYAVFAGRECARALALMRVTVEDCNDDLEGATEAQLKTLADWEAKFAQKYGVAGRVVRR